MSGACRFPRAASVTVREAEPVTTGQQLVEDMDVLPGGGWMLYDSNLDGSQDIWLMSLQSNQPIQLTRDSTEEFGPTWSPNGKEIAYYGIRDGVRQVFVMRAGGKGIRQVTSDTLQHHQPRWSPDGEHLVFNATVGLGEQGLRGRPEGRFLVEPRHDQSATTSARAQTGRPTAGGSRSRIPRDTSVWCHPKAGRPA
jgi:Tol biopolymer transport system component